MRNLRMIRLVSIFSILNASSASQYRNLFDSKFSRVQEACILTLDPLAMLEKPEQNYILHHFTSLQTAVINTEP
jgi:hypothetical protein